MPTTEAREQVGKFEFSLAVSEKPDGEQRVDALATWLLAEWERESLLPSMRLRARYANGKQRLQGLMATR